MVHQLDGNSLLLMVEPLLMSNVHLTIWASDSSHINYAYLIHSLPAPEYALDEQLVTASDMYSLGCLVHAVHKKGEPPFKNHGGLSGLRENSTKPVPGLDVLDPDLQGNILFPCFSFS